MKKKSVAENARIANVNLAFPREYAIWRNCETIMFKLHLLF